MAVRKILRMGDPRLREVAAPVSDYGTPQLQTLVRDLLDSMQAEDGAGLAAPQIGVGLRVVVFGFERNPRYPHAEPVPRTVLVNPVIEPLGEHEETAWEGCLSLPGLRGMVPRHTHIRYTGFDPFGNRVERECRDFHARVVQHECDHLDGILYPQRIRDLRRFGFIEELQASGELEPLPCDTPAE